MKKYHWWKCQNCGAEIGILGRGFQAILPAKLYWHKCIVVEEYISVWMVDREGVCYLPVRTVILKAKRPGIPSLL